MRLAIFGSCVSRDAMEFVTGEDIRLVSYYARSSFASAFSPEPVPDTFSATIPSAFQSRQVRQDFRKGFARSLPGLDCDMLLIDLTDERFQLFVPDSGGIVTVSRELGSSGFPGPLTGTHVKPFTDAHFSLWDQGWSRFIDIMRRGGRIDRIRVNHVLWADRTETGVPIGGKTPPEYVARANRHLCRLHDRMRQDLPASAFYGYDPALLQGKDGHKWGHAPFHFIDAFYRQTLRLITADPLYRQSKHPGAGAAEA